MPATTAILAAFFSHRTCKPAFLLIPNHLRSNQHPLSCARQLCCGVERITQADRALAVAAAAAHDFNNELTVILSSVTDSIQALEPGHPARTHLQDLQEAAWRCARTNLALLRFGLKHRIDLDRL